MSLNNLQATVVVEDKSESQEQVQNDKDNKIVQWCENNWKAIFGELVATTSLLLFGCMAACRLPDDMPSPPIYGAIAFGFTVAMNIQIFGHISGAHMNPVVSLGAVIFGTMSVPLFIMYTIAQCAGAILGFGLLSLITFPLAPDGMCSTLPRTELSTAQALGIEIVLTAALNLVNCGVWDSRNTLLKDSIPVKFGLVITCLSIVGGPLTGASMNPARTLAPSIFNGTWEYHWIYWVGPVLGGALSPLVYRYIWKPSSKGESPEEQPLDKHS